MEKWAKSAEVGIKNVLLATLCAPPKERPVKEIAPGFPFHHDNLGFDYRQLQARLKTGFKMRLVTGC